jgi:hypothetical protein
MQFNIFSLKYSINRITAAIAGMTTNRCAVHSTFAAKYSAPAPVIMSTQVEVKSNVITVLHTQDSTIHSTYLRFHYIYMSTGQCSLYPTFSEKYSAHQPVCGMSTLVPAKSSVVAVLHI